MHEREDKPTRIERAAERAVANRGGLLASVLPSLAFVVADRLAGIIAAMVAATVVAAAAIIYRRVRGQGVGWLLPISLAYVVVRGIAGVVTESDTVFFGMGLVLSAGAAIVVGITAFTRAPVAAFLLPLVTPYRYLTRSNAAYRRVAAQITAVWAVAELMVTAAEWRHLSDSGGSEFVIARTLIAWPFMAVVIFFLIAYARFRLDPYEYRLARDNERSTVADGSGASSS